MLTSVPKILVKKVKIINFSLTTTIY